MGDMLRMLSLLLSSCCPPQVLTSKLGELEKKYGLQDKAKVGAPARHAIAALLSTC